MCHYAMAEYFILIVHVLVAFYCGDHLMTSPLVTGKTGAISVFQAMPRTCY